MFFEELFPTSNHIATTMLKKISPYAVHFLEPNAGKGDLALAILNAGRESDRWSHQNNSRFCVDVIESNPDLVAILHQHPELTIVGYDWLTYSGISYYDAILLNPPFSQGTKHLLKAWDFLHAGEIVCLLNQDTIDNPYTEERRRLTALIADHGSVEALGPCFQDSERPTDVHVAMVYLNKMTDEDRIPLWHTSGQERIIDDHIGSPESLPALKDRLGNLEHFYTHALEEMFKAFSHVRKASLFMEALGTTIRDDRDARGKSKLSTILELAQTNTTAARAEFAKSLRRSAWLHVFEQTEFRKWLDSTQTEELLRDLERHSTIPFNKVNIKGTLTNVFLQRTQLFEKSVWNVFLNLTSHYKGNTTGDIGSGDGQRGWKTNDSYKVNTRLVFPYGCHFSYERFDIWSRHTSEILYNDLDRILAVLDGQRYEEIITIGRALTHAFDTNRQHPGTCDSTYFHIRYFKKGTVHLTWKRRDLLAAFNTSAAKGRHWIGAQTQHGTESSDSQDSDATPAPDTRELTPI